MDAVKPLPASSIVFLAALGLYGATLARTVGPGDAGEFAVVMTRWGVAHASGYPLLTLLGNLFARLLPFGEAALLPNLLSALASAIAVVFVARTTARLTGREAAGIVAGLSIATSRAYWEYSLVAEVFGLNNLLASALIYLLVRFGDSVKAATPEWKLLPWTALCLSGAVTHHQTLALVGVPVLVALLAETPKLLRHGADPRALRRSIGVSILVGILGLIVLAYLPLAAAASPALNWDDPRDWEGFERIILRKDFGTGSLMSAPIPAQRVLDAGLEVSPSGAAHNLLFWRELPRQMGWLTACLGAVGIVALWRKRRTSILVFLAAYAAFHVFFFSRVNAPILPLFLGVTERFYILPHVVLGVVAGSGAGLLLGLGASRGVMFERCLTAVLLLGGPVVLVFAHVRDVDMSRNTFTRDHGVNVLESLPENAILFGQGDLLHNAVHYAQECLGVRRDVAFIDLQKLTYPWYVRDLRRKNAIVVPDSFQALDPSKPAGEIRALFDANAATRPLAVTRLEGTGDESWMRGYRMTPFGLWSRVDRRDRPRDNDAYVKEWRRILATVETRSLKRDYHERTFEVDERTVYFDFYALGSVIFDVAADLEKFRPDTRPCPEAAKLLDFVLALPGATPGKIADLRARNMLNVITTDVFFDRTRLPSEAAGRLWMDKIRAFADAAIATDKNSPEALRIVAKLAEAVGDHATAFDARDRLLGLRPGDYREFEEFMRSLHRLGARDPQATLRSYERALARQTKLGARLDEAARLAPREYGRLAESCRQALSQLQRSVDALRVQAAGR